MKRYFKLLFVPSIFLFLILCLNTNLIYASNELYKVKYSDNFDNNKQINWVETNGYQGTWYINNGNYVGTVMKYGADNPSISSYTEKPIEDYQIDFDIKSDKGIDKFILFGFQSMDETYGLDIKSSFDGGGNIIELSKNTPQLKQSLISVPFINNSNQWYHVKLIFKDNRIQLFIDNNINPILDFTDPHPLRPGGIALMIWPGAYAGSGSITTVRYDNIVVRDLNHLDVPDYKQTDPLWSTDLMGNSGLKLKNYGCYMTSITNVLNFYGYNKLKEGDNWNDLTPKTMNTWLSNNSGYDLEGYLLNPSVLVLANQIRESTTSSLPKIEFKSNNFNQATYSSEIVDNNFSNTLPTIGKVKFTSYLNNAVSSRSTHFVSLVGTAGDSYLINDPLDYATNLDDGYRYLNELWGVRQLLPVIEQPLTSNIVKTANISSNYPNGIIFNTVLPTSFLITDSLNNRTGIINNEIFEEIPNSFVEINEPLATGEEIQNLQKSTVIAFVPNFAAYKVLISGSEGTHSFKMVNYNGSNPTVEQNTNVTIPKSGFQEYQINNDGTSTTILPILPEVDEVTFESIRLLIIEGSKTGKIKPTRVVTLTTQLKVAEKFSKKLPTTSITLLKVLKNNIERLTPKYIDPNYSVSLLSQIDILIDSLNNAK